MTPGGIGDVGALSVALLCLILAAPARAENGNGDGGASARLRAQELLDRGNELFRAGEMAEALRAYREAHEAFQSPKLFFNMGRCEMALAQRAPAIQHFKDFLRQVSDPDPIFRTEAETSITALAAELTSLELARVPPNAAVRIDGQPAGLAPFDQPIWLEPGTHTLSVDRAGEPPWITSIEGRAGATVAITVPETGPPPPLEGPSNPPPAAPDLRHPIWRRWWFWTGVALLIAGGTALTIMKLRSCDQTVCE